MSIRFELWLLSGQKKSHLKDTSLNLNGEAGYGLKLYVRSTKKTYYYYFSLNDWQSIFCVYVYKVHLHKMP